MKKSLPFRLSIYFMVFYFSIGFLKAVNAESIYPKSYAVPLPAQSQVYRNSDGEIIYNLSTETTVQEIKYIMGRSVQKLDSSNSEIVIDRYFLSPDHKKNEWYDYLDISVNNGNIVSYALLRNAEQDLVAKAAKTLSPVKYIKIDKHSIMTVSLGDDYEESRIRILNMPEYEYTVKIDHKLAEYLVSGRRIVISSDDLGKLNRIELFFSSKSN